MPKKSWKTIEELLPEGETLKDFVNKQSELPSPSNAAEFITDDGRRYVWSESNVRYEEVPEDGGSFQVLRLRLTRAEERINWIKKELEELDHSLELSKINLEMHRPIDVCLIIASAQAAILKIIREEREDE